MNADMTASGVAAEAGRGGREIEPMVTGGGGEADHVSVPGGNVAGAGLVSATRGARGRGGGADLVSATIAEKMGTGWHARAITE